MWLVPQAVAGKVAAAANKAARVALGVPIHTPNAGTWAELRVDDTARAWAAAVVRLWGRVAALPRGRLAREAWEWAWGQRQGSSFVRRLRAAHAAALGAELPASGRPVAAAAVM